MSRGYCCFRSLLCLSHYLVPLHKMLDLWSYVEDTCIKPISSTGSTNHNIFWWHFCSHGIKNWKSWPKFFKFQSMSILVIYSNRWQETVSMLQQSIAALFKNMRILKFKSQLTFAFFAVVNHLSRCLSKQNLTGSKAHGLWLVDFDLLCVFLWFIGSLLVIVTILDGSKNWIMKAAFQLESLHLCEKCSK